MSDGGAAAKWKSLSGAMHKQFSVFVSVNEKEKAGEAERVPHERQLHREFLAPLPAHSTIAVKASGHYSWLVDEMEQLGHYTKRANPVEAKRRIGLTEKTELRRHSQAPRSEMLLHFERADSVVSQRAPTPPFSPSPGSATWTSPLGPTAR
jgi:hypothetical protein